MSNLQFSSSEIRFATVGLAAIAAFIPAVYFLKREAPQKSTPHLKTFRKYIDAYSTLRPAALATNAASSFSHTILPISLQIPTRGLQNSQQHAHMIFSLFSDFQMIPQSTPENDGIHFSAETNTAIAHCKMGGKVNEESEKGKQLISEGVEHWWTECVLMVRMSPDGTQVEEVREFVDSKKAAELQIRLSNVLSN